MATKIGTITTGQVGPNGDRLYLTNWATDARTGAERWTAGAPALLFPADERLFEEFGTGGRVDLFETDREGSRDNRHSVGAAWFEDVHVIPREIDLGNILTEQTVPFDLFNGFRYESKELTTFDNNAGAGISTVGLPALPIDVFQLDTVQFDVVFSTDGDPTIDGSLDITFGGATISVPVTGSRIVMFPYQPEAPLQEVLEFLTDVLVRMDGSEQRIALRKNPRQRFQLRVLADNPRERQRIANLLFDWQGRVFGLPVWTESTRLSSAATLGDTTVNVQTTADADYRVGGLAIVLQDDDTFDALEVTSITGTTLEFESPLTSNYGAGTRVMPLRSVLASDVVRRTKQQVKVEEFQIEFEVLDNDANLASTTGFTIHPTDSKVILDGAPDGIVLNVYTGGSESMRRRLARIDSGAGQFAQSSPWDRSKEDSELTIYVADRANLWNVRQLFHALRGRQVSFYLPTFFDDVTPAGSITSGGSTLLAVNAGYFQFVNDRVPRTLLRLTTTAGAEYIVAVNSSTEVDDDEESFSVTVLLKNQAAAGPTWPDNIALADIARIEFVQKVRLAADEVEIQHDNGAGQATFSAKVETVIE